MQQVLNHFPTFEDFLKEKRNFSVLRILSKENYLHKDNNKCESFDTLEQATAYYKRIKNESKANYLVITGVFEGLKPIKGLSKMKDCRKKEPLLK